jgi:bisphosphoglycerate-independent phosphoglycerate mutase (AlkP superfamily)
MASVSNAIVDKAIDSTVNNLNPAAVIPKSMISFVDNEKISLQQIASNFLARSFEFRTKEREKKINVVQLMSEYDVNFSTPVCYL